MISYLRPNADDLPYVDDHGLIVSVMVLTHFVLKHTMDKLMESKRYAKLSLSFDGHISMLAQGDCSPGELAAKLGKSKQLCSKTIKELENLGLIERRKNPEDSRSSLLSLSRLGRQLVADGFKVTSELDRQFADAIGEERLLQLIAILEKLCQNLGLVFPASYRVLALENTDTTLLRPTRLNLMLPQLDNYFQQALLSSLTEKGFPGLKPSFGQVLGMINRESRKMQTIAAVSGVSKQAIAVIAAELELLGYITREPDLSDKRQFILSLSPLGQKLVEESARSVAQLEASISALFSPEENALLDETMRALYLLVARAYNSPSALSANIQQLSEKLLNELGVSGAKALAKQLMTITREER